MPAAAAKPPVACERANRLCACIGPTAICAMVGPNTGINISAAMAIAVSILASPDFDPAGIGVIIISPSVRGSKHSLISVNSWPCTATEN